MKRSKRSKGRNDWQDDELVRLCSADYAHAMKMASIVNRIRRVCVFCGSNLGRDPAFAAAAAELGCEIGRRGWGLV